nr:hypothetical protein [Cellulosilyticum ruminicola]
MSNNSANRYEKDVPMFIPEIQDNVIPFIPGEEQKKRTRISQDLGTGL